MDITEDRPTGVHVDEINGLTYRWIDPSQFAQVVEQVRAFRRLHGDQQTTTADYSIKTLGPYEPCEVCGVPIVGTEHRTPDGELIKREMSEIISIRLIVGEWEPGGECGRIAGTPHRCAGRSR